MSALQDPRRADPRRRGGALVFALIAVMVVSVMTVGLVQLSAATVRRQTQSVDRGRAFYLAEAGLAEAYTGLMIGKTGNVGSAGQPARFGQGLLWVESTDLDDDQVELVCTARCGGGQAVLSLVAERGEHSVASLGVFAADGLVVPAGSRIDGYDSAEGGGLLLSGVGGEQSAGRVGSNGAIALRGTLSQPTTVVADLAPGVGEDVRVGTGVTHRGEIAARVAPALLPPVEPPFEPELSGRTHDQAVPLLMQPGDVGLDHLRVAGGAQVILQGPLRLVVNELSVASKGSLKLDTASGTIELYARGAIDLAPGASISTTSSDPSKLLVQLSGEGLASLAATGKLHGVIYAPQGRVVLGSSMEVFGAAVGRTLELAPGAQLHFDRNLDALAAEAALPRLISWRVLDMSSPQGAGLSRDPFQLLGLEPGDLPSIEAAHQDQVLHVKYTSPSGGSQSFDGMESAFDWTEVKDVHLLLRDGKLVTVGVGASLQGIQELASSAAMDAINKVPKLGSSELKDVLLSKSPLSSQEIVAATQRVPWMNTSDLKAVLEENAPLGSVELNALLDRHQRMNTSDLKTVLLASSPLPTDVLARVVLGGIGLTPSDALSVLGAQP